jgi:hypothetical protein
VTFQQLKTARNDRELRTDSTVKLAQTRASRDENNNHLAEMFIKYYSANATFSSPANFQLLPQTTMFIQNIEVIPISLKNYRGSIDQPTKLDVLCGKDTTLARHIGNQRFREQIQSNLPRYLAARSKQDKMKITKSIVKHIASVQGARFLKMRANGDWVEIDQMAARDKVSHALRFAARQKTKLQEQERSFHSDEASSSSSSIEQEQESSAAPPALPPPKEIERISTNVDELFQGFENLTDPHPFQFNEAPRASLRRDSARLLLSLLSSMDFETSVGEDDNTFSFDAQERKFLGMDETENVTQWAAC